MGANFKINLPDAESDIERAQQLMLKAFVETVRGKRIKLAQQALDFSSDCTDAYILLARENATGKTEQINLWRQAADSARRLNQIEGGAFEGKSSASKFWRDMQNKACIKAFTGFAHKLFEDGLTVEAIDCCNELLANYPDENSVKGLLAMALVELNRLSEAEALFSAYKGEPSAHLLYSRALCLFKSHGDSTLSVNALELAIDYNRNVMRCLCGAVSLPEQKPESFASGTMEEAYAYVAEARRSWIEDKAAIAWIVSYLQKKLRKRQAVKTFPGIKLLN